jgi:hypothetical protein
MLKSLTLPVPCRRSLHFPAYAIEIRSKNDEGKPQLPLIISIFIDLEQSETESRAELQLARIKCGGEA